MAGKLLKSAIARCGDPGVVAVLHEVMEALGLPVSIELKVTLTELTKKVEKSAASSAAVGVKRGPGASPLNSKLQREVTTKLLSNEGKEEVHHRGAPADDPDGLQQVRTLLLLQD